MIGSAFVTDAKEWIVQRCTRRLRPAERVGGFELIYEDFDIEPVTEEKNAGEAQIARQFRR